MAVHLPSDIVSDVMRNADPARRGAAVARLQSAAGPGAMEFARAVEGVGQNSSAMTAEAGKALSAAPGSVANPSEVTEAYRGFERMVLRNLFETLLPEESTGSFGGGPSAGVWRSMAADQLAGVVAENGGIGIAAMIDGSGDEPGPKRSGQWPYFALDSIGSVRG